MDGGGGLTTQPITPNMFARRLAQLMKERRTPGQEFKILGLLATRPELDICKKEVIESWDWFDHRTGDQIEVVVLGFGDMKDRKAARTFSKDWLGVAIEFIERESTWNYSGDSDLILCNVKYYQNGGVFIDLRNAICIKIDRAIKEGIFTSLSGLIEELRRYVNNHPTKDPLWGFSDGVFKRTVAESLILLLYATIPEAIRAKFKSLEHVAVRSIARPTTRLHRPRPTGLDNKGSLA